MGKTKTGNAEGAAIRKRRLQLGMTQEDVALEVGISISQYQRYEYGLRRFINVPMRIGLRICRVLKMDPHEVIAIPVDEDE